MITVSAELTCPHCGRQMVILPDNPNEATCKCGHTEDLRDLDILTFEEDI